MGSSDFKKKGEKVIETIAYSLIVIVFLALCHLFIKRVNFCKDCKYYMKELYRCDCPKFRKFNYVDGTGYSPTINRVRDQDAPFCPNWEKKMESKRKTIVVKKRDICSEY